ncbi:coiled-coil domain-containing protein 122 [Sphaeramia orbicularis]|uniref:coiled-coil domain-containing protein 122 n=1 Tax=Sphaeramia orbicularis TaxID=375764 RepID=UPI00117E3CFD|nr:coiled-coil domain-containing protein 122 [Sphaeramia orbicularis]
MCFSGIQEDPDFTLSKAVEDVSQHSHAQTEALKQKQKTLKSLQTTLSGIEEKCKSAVVALRAQMRERLILEDDMENLEQHRQVLFARCTSITMEITDVQSCIREEVEKVSKAQAGYNTYRKKMEGHRAAVFHVANQTKAHKELEEKRVMVMMLTQEKEELKRDLENPNGNSVQMEKEETNALKEEISVMNKIMAQKREQLRKESESHIQFKREIEIQQRRFEAIGKRLRCQLSKAHAVHRQMTADIYHMERQIAELKRQLESSQGPVVSGH